MAAAVRGYRMIITMPEKMSREKQVVLEALGAEIIRTPTEAAFDAPESHISVANRLREVLPNAHILDQYGNEDNPLAHELNTARRDPRADRRRTSTRSCVPPEPEARSPGWRARSRKRDAVVSDHRRRSRRARSSPGPSEPRAYKVEGIGYDFIPDVLNRELVDRWIKTNDRDSFRLARQLIKQEGFAVRRLERGSAVWAAIQSRSSDMPEGSRVVVILPDSVRNYMTKFVDDAWMKQHGFFEDPGEIGTIAEMIRSLPPKGGHHHRGRQDARLRRARVQGARDFANAMCRFGAAERDHHRERCPDVSRRGARHRHSAWPR